MHRPRLRGWLFLVPENANPFAVTHSALLLFLCKLPTTHCSAISERPKKPPSIWLCSCLALPSCQFQQSARALQALGSIGLKWFQWVHLNTVPKRLGSRPMVACQSPLACRGLHSLQTRYLKKYLWMPDGLFGIYLE